MSMFTSCMLYIFFALNSYPQIKLLSSSVGCEVFIPTNLTMVLEKINSLILFIELKLMQNSCNGENYMKQENNIIHHSQRKI